MLILRILIHCFVLAAAGLILALAPELCFGDLSRMSEEKMKDAHGQAGLTQFSMTGDTARLFLDIHMETYTTIGNFSTGKPSDWDIQFDNVSIGNSTTDPVVIDGLVFIVDFDASSNLERVVIGSNRVSGDVSATMNQYSGVYNNLLTGGSDSPVNLLDGDVVGAPGDETTFHFDSGSNDMGMFLVLTNDAGKVGFQLVSGYNESSLVVGNWWDSP